MATFYNQNTGIGYQLPDEGQVFRASSGDPALFVRQGGKIFEYDPIRAGLLSEQQRSQIGNFGAISQYLIGKTYPSLGINFGALPTFNIGDITSVLGGQIETRDINMFKQQQITPAQNVTIATDPLLQQALSKSQQQGTSLAQTSIAGLPNAPAELSQQTQNLGYVAPDAQEQSELQKYQQQQQANATQKMLEDSRILAARVNEELARQGKQQIPIPGLTPEQLRTLNKQAGFADNELTPTGTVKPEVITVGGQNAQKQQISQAGTYQPTYPGQSQVGTQMGGVSTLTDFIKSLNVALSEALGIPKETADVTKAASAINDFFSNRKSAEQILKDEFATRGIEAKTTLIKELDAKILESTKAIRNIPENLRTTLADVGVSQAQLERLALKDAQKPTELLRDLLEQRGALAEDVNRSLSFAEKFSNTQLDDQTAKLAALQWNLTSEKGDLTILDDKRKEMMTLFVDDRKKIFETAKAAAEANAPQSVIDSILGSFDSVSALSNASDYLGKDKFTFGYDAYGNPVAFNTKTGQFGQATGIITYTTGNQSGVNTERTLIDVPIKLRPSVEKITGAWDNEAVVKRYSALAEGAAFLDSINPNTKNSSENIGAVYAFAKAMDPDSVVREGEYATVEKYAQSLAESYGLQIQRFYNNTNFLTAEAITNMKSTLRMKYNIQLSAYNSLLTEYGRRINGVTGKTNGTEFLHDYSIPFQNIFPSFIKSDVEALNIIQQVESNPFYYANQTTTPETTQGGGIVDWLTSWFY